MTTQQQWQHSNNDNETFWRVKDFLISPASVYPYILVFFYIQLPPHKTEWHRHFFSPPLPFFIPRTPIFLDKLRDSLVEWSMQVLKNEKRFWLETSRPLLLWSSQAVPQHSYLQVEKLLSKRFNSKQERSHNHCWWVMRAVVVGLKS